MMTSHGTPDPTTQRKPDSEWPTGRAALLLFLILDLTAVFGWLLYYPGGFDRVKVVVGGLWTAVIVFLAYVGIERRTMRLSEFMGLTPVRLVAITYTSLILLALPLWAAFELPTHYLVVSAPQNAADMRWSIEIYAAGDTAPARHELIGQTERSIFTRRGDARVIARAEGYDSVVVQEPIYIFSLIKRVQLSAFQPRNGVLRILPAHDVTVDIVNLETGQPIRTQDLRDGSAATLTLRRGQYAVLAAARGFHADTFPVALDADTFDVPIALLPIAAPIVQNGTLLVRSAQSVAGEAREALEVYVDSRMAGYLGERISLRPGHALGAAVPDEGRRHG
jgi:hypothetical protein